MFCEAAQPHRPGMKTYRQLLPVDQNGEVACRDIPRILATIKCGPELRGAPLPKDHNAAVMRVKRKFSEQAKHRHAERRHTPLLTHAQRYALRELEILYRGTKDDGLNAQVNLLERAFLQRGLDVITGYRDALRAQ